MKVSIEGFNQELALTFVKEVPYKNSTKVIRIDCTDLVVLRWFVDFYPDMRKMQVDGHEYAWLTHKKLMKDLPILNISRKACIERMQKLVEFDILTYRCIKDGGTFSLYSFGKNYMPLVCDSKGRDVDQPQGRWSTDHREDGQPTNKDKTIKDKTIKDNYLYSAIIDYLNFKTGSHYKDASKKTRSLIDARVREGFTLDDFKTVIDKKCEGWLHTEFARYLCPDTLFGTKFEKYLNEIVVKGGANDSRRGTERCTERPLEDYEEQLRRNADRVEF